MEPVNPPGTIAQFLPLLLLTAIIVPAIIYLIRKKGKSMLLLLPALIPFVNCFVFVYLFAQTNKDVLEEIADLKRRLKALQPDEPIR